MNKMNLKYGIEDFWQDKMRKKFPFEKFGTNIYMSAQIMASMADYNVIADRKTSYAFGMYEHLCKTRNVKPLGHIAFSQFIKRNFNYWIQDKRVGKIKCRVFREI